MVDSGREVGPGLVLLSESGGSTPGERVSPPSPPLHLAPIASQKTRLLQPMESRIYRALWKIKRLTAPESQLLDHGVAMFGAVRNDSQQQEIEMPFQRLPSHTSHVYT